MAEAENLDGGANHLEPPKPVAVPPSLSSHFDEIETANNAVIVARGALNSAQRQNDKSLITKYSEIVAEKQQQHEDLVQQKIVVITGMIDKMKGEMVNAEEEEGGNLQKLCKAYQISVDMLKDSRGAVDRSVRGLKLGITLGKGAFGRVKLGMNESTGQCFAMKFIKKKNPNFRLSSLRREVKCMQKINHPNVLNVLCVNENIQYPCRDGTMEDCFLIIMDHMPGGDLYDLVMYTGPMTEKLGRTLFKQLLDGLKAIHDCGITHRDIKPSNILIDQKFQLKHTDFGLAHIAPEDTEDFYRYRMMRPRVGTRGYRAPELHFERIYTNKVDVFSLGVCLYIMLTKRQPFKKAHVEDRWYNAIIQRKYSEYWKSVSKSGFPNLTDDCKEFFNRILCYQPRQRITLHECFEHPWMKEDVYEQKELYRIMHKLHKKGRQKKMEDTKRKQRLQSSITDYTSNRALGDDHEDVKAFESHKVPAIDQVDPKWFSWEMTPDGNAAKILALAKQFLEEKLLCKFEITGDYRLSSKYLAQVENEEGEITFDLRVVKRNNKNIFVCAPKKTTWFTLVDYLEKRVLDGLVKGNHVTGYYLEKWDEGYIAPKAEFDFKVFDKEDEKLEEYSHELLEDEEKKAIKDQKAAEKAKAEAVIEEEVIAKEN